MKAFRFFFGAWLLLLLWNSRPLSSETQEKTMLIPYNFPSFAYPLPADAREWEEKKPILRAKLRRLLGNLPPVFTPQPTVLHRESNSVYSVEKFIFDNGAGSMVFGYFALPVERAGRCPAILYHHYHGGEYTNGKEEIFKKWPSDTPPVEAYARAGYAVLAIDVYAFGDRQRQGPANERETGMQTEAALFKTFIWEGKTLWGMIVRDDLLALNYLLFRPEIDPERIGATGMSMGSTRTWWLAALDDRIRAAVCVSCLTRYQDLIQRGEVNQHGIYYYVPNLLQEGIDMEAVVGLIAPRPLLTLTGDQDEGSPIDGVNTINRFVARLYSLYNSSEQFRGVVYKGVGHQYTPEMWKETLAWFDKYLKK